MFANIPTTYELVNYLKRKSFNWSQFFFVRENFPSQYLPRSLDSFPFCFHFAYAQAAWHSRSMFTKEIYDGNISLRKFACEARRQTHNFLIKRWKIHLKCWDTNLASHFSFIALCCHRMHKNVRIKLVR
jgi:hypothetical protein